MGLASEAVPFAREPRHVKFWKSQGLIIQLKDLREEMFPRIRED